MSESNEPTLSPNESQAQENGGINENTSPVDPGKPDVVKNGNTANVSPLPPGTKKSKKNNRLTITTNFSGEEPEYLNEIIQARMKSGLTLNYGHFIRQCVDFTINHRPGSVFAMPDIPKVDIKDGFYNPIKVDHE